jgi:hypothetical protein
MLDVVAADVARGAAPVIDFQTENAPAVRDRFIRQTTDKRKGEIMKIEFPYEFTKIGDVKAGSFFATHEDDRLAFFMLVARNGAQENDLVAFTAPPRPDNVLPAMTSTSFLRGGAVAVIRDAVMRPDFQELLQGVDKPPIGSITFQPGKISLWAASPNRMARSAIDLSRGSYSDAQHLDAFMYVKRWEVGFVRDEKFAPLFQFDGNGPLPLASLEKAG